MGGLHGSGPGKNDLAKAIFLEPDVEKALILDNVKDLVIYHDLDMKILWANREAGASVKKDPRDLAGKYCWEIWHQGKEPCQGCPVILALETGQAQMAEIVSPDGREWYIRGYPIKSSGGELLGVAEFCLDITERKLVEKTLGKYREALEQGILERTRELTAANEALKIEVSDRKNAEAALRVSEEKYRALVENTSYMIYSLDTLGCFTYANPAIERYIAPLKAKDALGQHFSSFVHPDDLPGLMVEFERSLSQEMGPCEFRVVCGDGSICHVQSSSRPLHENGRLIGTTAIMVDITERKRIEMKIRESEEKFRVLAETTSCAIAIFQDHRVKYVNPATVRMSGFSREELLSMSLEDAAGQGDPEARAIIISAYEQYMSGVPIPRIAEIKLHRKDGKDVWVQTDIGRIEYHGKPAILVSVFDVTERKAAEEELSRVRDELEIRVYERTAELRMSNEALRQEILERRQAEIALIETKMQAELYVDLMGHDINNLNQIAAGYLELALDTLEIPENQRELLEKPLDALMNSSRLINNVRKLQRIKTRQSHLEIIDLNRVIEDAYAQYSGIVDASIMVNCDAPGGARVVANELLSDVFSNLIGNAIKHSHGLPVIRVNLTEDRTGDKKSYRVTVEDHGPGVPDEHKQIIFNRQQRGQTKAPGSGIGLHLVKTLVDEYGGQVWVEDRIKGDTGQGSRFVVVLPAAE